MGPTVRQEKKDRFSRNSRSSRFDAISNLLLYPGGSADCQEHRSYRRYFTTAGAARSASASFSLPRPTKSFFLGTVSDPFRDYLGACAARFWPSRLSFLFFFRREHAALPGTPGRETN